MIDPGARDAFLRDLKALGPSEIILLGDHVDCGGMFSVHQPSYLEDVEYSYEEDCNAANVFLDAVSKAAPRARSWYIEGNHEQHIERWVSRNFTNKKDATYTRGVMAPEHKLALKRRGIKYIRSSETYMGLAIPGTIRIGKCFFLHGYRAGKHATSAHLDDFGANLVHGHTHRSQAVMRRTASSGGIGAWCPGTLAKLQPLYLHTSVSSWTHGFAMQLVENTGRFMHINVPIVDGNSMLKPLLDKI